MLELRLDVPQPLDVLAVRDEVLLQLPHESVESTLHHIQVFVQLVRQLLKRVLRGEVLDLGEHVDVVDMCLKRLQLVNLGGEVVDGLVGDADPRHDPVLHVRDLLADVLELAHDEGVELVRSAAALRGDSRRWRHRCRSLRRRSGHAVDGRRLAIAGFVLTTKTLDDPLLDRRVRLHGGVARLVWLHAVTLASLALALALDTVVPAIGFHGSGDE